MVKEKTAIIKSKVVFSDDEKYRYKLTRVWDNSKKKIAFIMLNPSKADVLKDDKTVMNITNYSIENDYGTLIIVNLFSYMATNPKELTKRDIKLEKYNEQYIKQACEEVDEIIIGWGSDKKKYIERKRETEKLLTKFESQIKCFEDEEGRKPRHPRDLNNQKWKIVKYEFQYT